MLRTFVICTQYAVTCIRCCKLPYESSNLRWILQRKDDAVFAAMLSSAMRFTRCSCVEPSCKWTVASHLSLQLLGSSLTLTMRRQRKMPQRCRSGQFGHFPRELFHIKVLLSDVFPFGLSPHRLMMLMIRFLARFFLPTSCSRLWFIVAFVSLARVPGSNRPSWLAWPQSKYSTHTFFFFVSVNRLSYCYVWFWLFL